MEKTARRRSGSETRQRGAAVALRVTAAEAAALTVAAEAAGLPVSAYLRRLVFGRQGVRALRHRPSNPTIPVPSRRDLAQVLGLLGRVGGNVNQLAKAFNTDATPPAASELVVIKRDIMAMREALMQALDPDHQGR